ncbi:MAG: hypothetical protein GX895_12185 [Clostridiales bacterium]|uniref:C39 family peptidase n=1 Tax=Clostridium sp. N3C TaxID=1776758 RepID=UPI00092E0D3A|nr:C39 family peptidase [Clostridium sp. N3C]NLZ49511.1 hypothetical protein [Clostridiales bacterium]SCN24734.1 hypothetical protein N3C_1952 [Clostridium sp. N3C]
MLNRKLIIKKTTKYIALSLIIVSLTGVNVFAADLSTEEQKAIPSSEESIKASQEKIRKMSERFKNVGKNNSNNLMAIPDVPYSKTLSTSGYINQPDNNTCGPTSAHNLLLNWGKNISLNTLKNDLQFDGKQTPFGDHWAKALNKHTNSNYYNITWSPNQSTIWTAFLGCTVDGHPFILDTHMSSKNGYLVGYENSGKDYWHYVTGIGYSGANLSDSYKKGVYHDPFNGRAGTYGVHSLELPKWKALLAERGIVW